MSEAEEILEELIGEWLAVDEAYCPTDIVKLKRVLELIRNIQNQINQLSTLLGNINVKI